VSPSLWKNRSFVMLWLAQATANVGDQFYGIALLWYLLQQTKSAASLSLIAIPEMIAGFLFYLMGGVLADRYNPRTLMIGADTARLLTVCFVGFMVLLGVPKLVFFLFTQFLIGIFISLFNPAKTVTLKAVVPEEQLSQANAILDTTFRTIRILAPMTIGLLAAVLPLAGMFFVNAAGYLLSTLLIFAIGPAVKQQRAPISAPLTPKQYLADIRAALREVLHKRYLFYILLFGNMGFFVWQVCWSVGYPVLANQMGQGDAGMLGMLIGSYGVGNLLGSLYMARFTYSNHLFMILLGWLFQAVGFTALALGQEYPYIVFTAAAISGVGGPLIGIPNVTAIQTQADSANIGKIFALNMLTFTGFCVISSSLGALWLSSWPVVQLFLASGMFLFAMVAAGLLLDRSERKKQRRNQLFSA
jgi:DHA3 family macrolide efflux protein-like MFS transporter